MSRIFLLSLSILFLGQIVVSCATFKVQYADEGSKSNVVLKSELDHTFFLIGDAGNTSEGEALEHFVLLKEELSEVNKNNTVLFLGDNLYEKGMPKKNHPNRSLSEHRLDVQLALVKNFKGRPIFIPGNHDYYSDGLKGLSRQADYIKKELGDKDAFLPKKGCPLKKIDITDEIILIIVDSQWYLENWDKHPTINDDCNIKSRHNFFAEFESLLKKNASKTTLVAIHHPLFSNGSHSGNYSFKSHIFPFNSKIPIPVIGTLANVIRNTGGISPQDMNSSKYLDLKKRMVTLAQKSGKIIFVSGHEHNLQYLVKDRIPQIVSGSGSKTSPLKLNDGGQFGIAVPGYAKLDVFKNGASVISFFTERNGKKELLYQNTVHPADTEKKEYYFKEDFPATATASIYKESEVAKSKSFQGIWGDHYRKYYGTKITVPTVSLDTLFGGLTVSRKGGGNQSRSLRLINPDKKEYVMRALRKSATQYLQAVAFKNQYVEGQFDDTYTESLLMDIYTTAHPYAPFTIGKLADAAGIFHTNPTLYYIPKQKALKEFNASFGDELYMIEERATSGHADVESFGFSDKLIGTDDLLEKIRKSDDNQIDEDAYIRARLFDMLIGDWDRHEDQWRWAEFKKGITTLYKPVPRDRDQAFSKNDGFILGLITRLIPALKLMQVYGEDMRSVKWFNLEPYPLDMALINKANYSNWKLQVAHIQENITENIIDEAFKLFPKEVRDGTVSGIKSKLLGRLKNLEKIAREYHAHLAKFAVVKGTDKDNWFDIKRLQNGYTSIEVFNIKNGRKGTKFFEKTYSKIETREIWVYGLDEKDVFKVSGTEKEVIPLRIVGGQNKDDYHIENGKKVTIYDYKTKKSTFSTNKGKRRLFNNYEANNYDYKKLKYSRNQLIPSIGSNPDDGFKIGLHNVYTVYGFERNPFTAQHTVDAAYYFATKGFDISYQAEFSSVFHRWNLLIASRLTSPNYSINFYGFGNNTENFEEMFGEDYHRVRLSTYEISPSLKWNGRSGAEFKVGVDLQSVEVENSNNRYINTLHQLIAKRNNYLGAHATFHYENYNNKVFPTLGMKFALKSGWKTNMDNNTENHTFLTPSLGIDHKLFGSNRLVLATKLKADILIGDQFEFYNAASIGGIDGLRGYRNQRFTGKRSFYQNTDLRLHIKKVKTELVPLQIGLFAGFDYGRVWLKNKSSNDWKTSYGAGFWLTGAEMINLNLSLFKSEEGSYFRFGLGFDF